MGTLVSIIDVIVLLLYIAYIPRGVKKDSGSLLLAILTALAVIIFASVSFTANVGLIAATSSLTQGIILLVLLLMAILAWASSSVSSPAA